MSFTDDILNRGAGYVKQIRKIESSIKSLNEQKKKLSEERKKIQGYLYQYMKSRGLEDIEGIRIEKLIPKKKAIKKKKKEREADVFDYCREIGIPDPNEFIKQLKTKQKGEITEEN